MIDVKTLGKMVEITNIDTTRGIQIGLTSNNHLRSIYLPVDFIKDLVIKLELAEAEINNLIEDAE